MSAVDEIRLFRFTIEHSVLLTVLMGIVSLRYADVVPGWVPVIAPGWRAARGIIKGLPRGEVPKWS